jgi:hypothetical protein
MNPCLWLSIRMAEAASKVLELSVEEVIEEYGVHFVKFAEDQVGPARGTGPAPG